MKKRRIGLLVIVLSLAGFATPNLLLTLIRHHAGTEKNRPAGGLREREEKFTTQLGDSSRQAKTSNQARTYASSGQDKK